MLRRPWQILPLSRTSNPVSVLDVQHGGDHYKKMGIQPVEYIHKNGLNFFEGNVIKYVTRHRTKRGAEDIKKAIHYLQMILEMEYGEQPNTTRK